jgi:hypothetical protein
MIKSIAQYIPGTQSRADRLLRASLARRASKGDVLLWIEYPDGDVKLKPAVWNSEISCWESAGGQRWFPRGKGGDPKRVGSTPVVQVHASDAGVISTESTLIGGAVEQGLVAPVDKYGNLLNRQAHDRRGRDPDAIQDLVDEELDDERAASAEVKEPVDAKQAATDGGGQRAVADYVPLYDGIEFALSDAVEYDPFPVREDDARQAAEWYEIAGRDDKSLLKYVGMGAVGAFLLVLGLLGFIWLLGEVGGGDSTGVSLMIDSLRLVSVFA